MEYTVRSSYAEMPSQVIAVNSDRRAMEQAQHYMAVVGAEVIPALRGAPPSEGGEIEAFAVLRDAEVIYRGLVVLKGGLWAIDSAAELMERAKNWLAVNRHGNASGQPGVYRVESPDGVSVIQAVDDGEAMESACGLDLRDPDVENSYTTTPFAVYSEEDGHLAGIGVQCMVLDMEEGAPSHSFSQQVDYLLGWFECIEAVWSTAVPDAEVETVQVEVITSLPRQPQIPPGVLLVTQDEDKHNPNVEALRILRATLMEHRRKELLDKGATRKEAELGAREWLWARLLESVNKNLRPPESSG